MEYKTQMEAAKKGFVTPQMKIVAEQEKIEAQLKHTLQQAMGEARRADFETGSVTWKKSKDSVVMDMTRLLKDQPDLQQRYAITKAGSRRFLVI